MFAILLSWQTLPRNSAYLVSRITSPGNAYGRLCVSKFPMQPVIEAISLTKKFGQLTAVNNLSFSIQEGEVYGFLGQNGAGKSTTIRMLLTLVTPTAGEIRLFGLNLHTHRKEILRQVGAVIEKPDVYQYLSAYENLQLFARLSKTAVARTHLMEQLERVGLAGRAHDKVKTFSQGMKQRLGIAIALVHNPRLIILDEPTNGLDPQGIADIRNLIVQLSREMGKTVLVSSHLLGEVEQMATRLLIIDKGTKLVEGATATLFSPAETIVELLTEDNTAAMRVLAQGEWAAHLQPPRNNRLLLKMHRDQVPGLHQWLVQHQVRVVSLQPRHSLEDYFLQITSGKTYVDGFTN